MIRLLISPLSIEQIIQYLIEALRDVETSRLYLSPISALLIIDLVFINDEWFSLLVSLSIKSFARHNLYFFTFECIEHLRHALLQVDPIYEMMGAEVYSKPSPTPATGKTDEHIWAY